MLTLLTWHATLNYLCFSNSIYCLANSPILTTITPIVLYPIEGQSGGRPSAHLPKDKPLLPQWNPSYLHQLFCWHTAKKREEDRIIIWCILVTLRSDSHSPSLSPPSTPRNSPAPPSCYILPMPHSTPSLY